MIQSIARLKHIAAACLTGLLAAAPVQATDWLMIQGTEPDGAAERARIWGFVQPQYTHMDGTKLKAGGWKGQDAIFNVIQPANKTESGFHLRRARLGVRGTGFPLDSDVNYFLLAEFGDNGVTASGGGNVRVTDASVTLNHLKKYTRVRFGQFKTPGSEDGLQAIHVHNYNNFSLPADQLLLERFRDTNGQDPTSGNKLCKDPAAAGPGLATPEFWSICNEGNGLNGSVGAYRDIGLQLFNSFTVNDGPGNYPWELSYAIMVGNGNGIARGDNDNNRELYYYLSAGQVFAGNGPRREDWKAYAWYQDGKRTIFDSGTNAEAEFDRDRWGVGGTYRKGKYRVYGEYIEADGMIPNAATGAAVGGARNSFAFGPAGVHAAGSVVSTFNTLAKDKARGWYLDFGYMVLPNLELDVRYDELDRGTNSADSNERNFERWTVGAQYFFNKKSRFTLNYEFRDTHAHGAGGDLEEIVHGTDDQLTAQVLVIF